MFNLVIASALALAAQSTTTKLSNWILAEQDSFCSLATSFKSGTHLKLEYHPRSDDYFLWVINPRGQNIVDGQRYRVKIDGDRKPFQTTGLGVAESGQPRALYVLASQPAGGARRANNNIFIENILLMDRYLKVSVDGRQVAQFRLAESPRALAALAKCGDKFATDGTSNASQRLKGRIPAKALY